MAWLPYTVRLAADLEVELCDLVARDPRESTTRFATVLVEVL